MRSSRVSRRGVLVLAICGICIAAVALRTDDRSSTPAMPTPEAATGTPGSAALRASIDPETGDLVVGHQPASKADSPELQEMLSRSTDGLVRVLHPDGSISVHLQGRFQSASVARIDSNGKLHTSCVDNADHADGCRREPATKSQGVER